MNRLYKTIAIILMVTLLVFCTIGCSDKNDTAAGDSSSVSTTSSTNSASQTQSNNATSSTTNSEINGSESAQTSSADKTNSQNSASDTQSEPVTDTTPIMYLDAVKSGDSITVTALVNNNTGLAGFGIKIAYEKNKVTPVEIKKGLTTVVSNLQQSTNCNGEVTAIYSDALGFKDNGVLFTVTFKVSDASSGEATFKIVAESNSFVDQNAQYTTFKTSNATISLK